MDPWRFVLTDRSHVPVGEIINASSRKVAQPLSKFDTASLQVRPDNPLADDLMSCEGYLKGYRNGVLRYRGPLISAEEVVDANNASIAVNSVSDGWLTTKRLAGKSITGATFSTLTDRAQIINTLLNTTNAENETGIQVRAENFAASAVTYTAGPYRLISEIITELATAYDGFDWRIVPLENFSGGAVTGVKTSEFQAQDVIGTDQVAAVVFEYGTGRHNIESYKRTANREAQANQVHHVPTTTGMPVITAIDATSISDWKLLEDLAQSDLLDAGLRQQLVDEHVRLRKNPRRVVEFSPVAQLDSSQVPQVGLDFDVGDFIRARAEYSGVTRFDAAFRVYGVSFEIDDLGNEKAVLTLTEEA